MTTGMKKIYKSMQGKEVDMTRLANQNETTMPVGNARATAAGDQLTPGGQLVKSNNTQPRVVADRVKVPVQNTPLRTVSAAVETKPVKTSSKDK